MAAGSNPFGDMSNLQSFSARQNITADLVRLLYTQARTSFIGTFLVGTLLVYSLYGTVPNRILFFWYGLLFFTNTIRAIIVWLYLYLQPPLEKTILWRDIFAFMTFAGGLCWGLA